MNRSTTSMLATAIMLCLSATVMAQPGQGRGEGRGPEGRGPEGRGGPGDMGRMMQMIPILAALDADKDGVISAKEIDNAAVALRKLDKNGDGELSGEEMRPARPEGGRGQGERRARDGDRPEGQAGRGAEMIERIMAADKNEDGKLSKEEAPERMLPLFDRLDGNEDGFIDKSEIEAMGSRMRGRGEAGGRGRGEAGGRGGQDGKPQRPKRPGSDGDN